MARVISKESLLKKIEKAQADVEKAKKNYDKAVEELDELNMQLEGIKQAELMEAITKSGKTLDDVYAWLQSN